jgi:hypothetical protein
LPLTDSFTFSGRTSKPWYKKINPVWWFQNDDEQTVDEAGWYHPEWPHWRRWLIWNVFRNPLQNLRCYVIGVQDRNYTVIGKTPVTTIQRDDMQPPETGWQWSLIRTLIPLPFASYCGKRLVLQFGWQYNGFFSFVKFNIKRG